MWNEMGEEFEAKKQLQVSVAGLDKSETVQGIDARLRNEIEKEVRRQFLSQHSGEDEETPRSVSQRQPARLATPMPVASPPRESATGSVLPLQSAVTRPIGSGDFGEEATEIFRL